MLIGELKVDNAFILAAGSNTRLFGTPPFMKPLLSIDGQSLIEHSVLHANAWGVKRPMIVAAPENWKHMERAISQYDTRHIIQNEPRGAIHALRLAVVHNWYHFDELGYSMVLCADNTYSFPPLNSKIGLVKPGVLFASKEPSRDNDERFTRYRIDIQLGRVLFYEPTTLCPLNYEGVWCGPMLIPTDLLRTMVKMATSLTNLMELCSGNGRFVYAMPMDCEDHGVN